MYVYCLNSNWDLRQLSWRLFKNKNFHWHLILLHLIIWLLQENEKFFRWTFESGYHKSIDSINIFERERERDNQVYAYLSRITSTKGYNFIKKKKFIYFVTTPYIEDFINCNYPCQSIVCCLLLFGLGKMQYLLIFFSLIRGTWILFAKKKKKKKVLCIVCL